MGVGGQRHAPAALPPTMTRYPVYVRIGGTRGRSGRVRKISPPPGFYPRNVQPVASRYTDYRSGQSETPTLRIKPQRIFEAVKALFRAL